MPAEGKPVGSAPEPANGAASKSRDGQTPPTRLLLTGSSHHFIGSIRPSVLDTTEGRVIRRLHQQAKEWIKEECSTYVGGRGGVLFHFLSKDKT